MVPGTTCTRYRVRVVPGTKEMGTPSCTWKARAFFSAWRVLTRLDGAGLSSLVDALVRPAPRFDCGRYRYRIRASLRGVPGRTRWFSYIYIYNVSPSLKSGTWSLYEATLSGLAAARLRDLVTGGCNTVVCSHGLDCTWYRTWYVPLLVVAQLRRT